MPHTSSLRSPSNNIYSIQPSQTSQQYKITSISDCIKKKIRIILSHYPPSKMASKEVHPTQPLGNFSITQWKQMVLQNIDHIVIYGVPKKKARHISTAILTPLCCTPCIAWSSLWRIRCCFDPYNLCKDQTSTSSNYMKMSM